MKKPFKKQKKYEDTLAGKQTLVMCLKYTVKTAPTAIVVAGTLLLPITSTCLRPDNGGAMEFAGQF